MSLDIIYKVFGKDSMKSATTLEKIGKVYQDKGDLD
jgi:hypothetical protein